MAYDPREAQTRQFVFEQALAGLDAGLLRAYMAPDGKPALLPADLPVALPAFSASIARRVIEDVYNKQFWNTN